MNRVMAAKALKAREQRRAWMLTQPVAMPTAAKVKVAEQDALATHTGKISRAACTGRMPPKSYGKRCNGKSTSHGLWTGYSPTARDNKVVAQVSVAWSGCKLYRDGKEVK
jgi:hypothetical protein